MKDIKFDFKRFGCNEDAVRDLVRAMGFEEKKPEGVIATPGMVIRHNADDRDRRVVVTYAISGGCRIDSDSLPVIDTQSGAAYVASARNFLTIDEEPIIGYEDD